MNASYINAAGIDVMAYNNVVSISTPRQYQWIEHKCDDLCTAHRTELGSEKQRQFFLVNLPYYIIGMPSFSLDGFFREQTEEIDEYDYIHILQFNLYSNEDLITQAGVLSGYSEANFKRQIDDYLNEVLASNHWVAVSIYRHCRVRAFINKNCSIIDNIGLAWEHLDDSIMDARLRMGKTFTRQL